MSSAHPFIHSSWVCPGYAVTIPVFPGEVERLFNVARPVIRAASCPNLSFLSVPSLSHHPEQRYLDFLMNMPISTRHSARSKHHNYLRTAPGTVELWNSSSALHHPKAESSHSHNPSLDDQKVRAVLNWPRPHSLKELQRFLGFANFYRRFIRNFSIVAAPLTSMTCRNSSSLTCTPEAFQKLKHSFTTAPILHHPEPSQTFIMEVDTSSTGIGVVFSQRHEPSNKMLPCTSQENSHLLNVTTTWEIASYSP